MLPSVFKQLIKLSRKIIIKITTLSYPFYFDNIIFEYIPSEFPQNIPLIQLFRAFGYTIKEVDGKMYDGSEKVLEQNLWAQKKSDE